jgi:hypothetical protein
MCAISLNHLLILFDLIILIISDEEYKLNNETKEDLGEDRMSL